MEAQKNPNWEKIKKEKRMVTIECDVCKKHFAMDDIQLETETMDIKGNAIAVDFWRCPECKIPYIVMLRDKRMRIKLQQQEDLLYKARSKYSDGTNIPESLLNQVRKIKSGIDDLELKLKDIYLETVTAQLQKEAE